MEGRYKRFRSEYFYIKGYIKGFLKGVSSLFLSTLLVTLLLSSPLPTSCMILISRVDSWRYNSYFDFGNFPISNLRLLGQIIVSKRFVLAIINFLCVYWLIFSWIIGVFSRLSVSGLLSGFTIRHCSISDYKSLEYL